MKHFTLVVMLMTPAVVSAYTWPNEPCGFTKLAEDPLNNHTTTEGWTADNTGGEIMSDPAAPISPSNVVRNYRDNASNHGSSFYYNFSPTVSEFFFAYAVKFSPIHYGWFNWYQKISLFDPFNQHMYMWAENDGSNTRMEFYLMDEASSAWVNSHIATSGHIINNLLQTSYPNNTWHIIEVYYKGNTGNPTSRTGALKMWVNGTAVMDHNDANLNPDVDVMKVTNIWDSIDTDLAQEEWLRYDHIYLSVPGGVCGGSAAGGGLDF